MLTMGDLFAGFGGFSLGGIAAGVQPLWAIDSWQVAVDSYNRNIPGNHAICARVEDVDPSTLPPVDIICASPPCQGYSVARNKNLPTHAEVDAGYSVLPFIETLRPRAFFIENVTGYVHSKPFKAIVACLHRLGYVVDWSNVNAADVGVPQTRRRLILRAMRGSLLPPYSAAQPWVGWYAAIEDLIPTLPSSAFAPWQERRLAEMPDYSFLLSHGDDGCSGIRMPVEPACAVTASVASHVQRAFLVSGTDATVRPADEPVVTVTATLWGKTMMPRALLIEGQNASRELAPLESSAPARTITNAQKSGFPRAWVAHPTADNDRFVVSPDDEPVFTIKTSGGSPRAFVVDGQTGTNGTTMQVIGGDDPMHTVAASSPHRVSLPAIPGGRVVRLTLPCLARFQTFPNEYVFPKKNEEAARGIGNAVPALLSQKLIEPIANVLMQDESPE